MPVPPPPDPSPGSPGRPRPAPVALYLVRHADAGDALLWRKPDQLRPLSETGRSQAVGLVDVLALLPVSRVLSSPYARCRQTVEPIAHDRELPVEVVDELAAGTRLARVLRLVRAVASERAVLCSHTDVIGAILAHLVAGGHLVDAGPLRLEPGSTWVLTTGPGGLVHGRYLPPASLDALPGQEAPAAPMGDQAPLEPSAAQA